jgi:plasmid stabilization system protein ParE
VRYRVKLTAKTEADIESALGWFQEQRAAIAGERWFARLLESIDTLQTHPDRCAVAVESEHLGVEIRELHFGKRRGVYRIVFRIEKRDVYILRVWHAARESLSPGDL